MTEDNAIPLGWESHNLPPIGYSDLDGRRGAFKIAVTEKNGRWYLYLGHLWHCGWSIIEVTDPASPRYVKFVDGPPNTPFIQAQAHLVYYTWFNAGLRVFDVSDPRRPVETAWFVPPTPDRRAGPMPETCLVTQTEDVAVDARGNIYITDKQWGLFILRYTGPNQITQG